MMSFQNAATWESPHLEDGLALFWYGKILIEQQRHQEVQILGGHGGHGALVANMAKMD